MVTTCHNAGVLVLVDTLLNHMAGINSGTGVAGSSKYPTVSPASDLTYFQLSVRGLV